MNWAIDVGNTHTVFGRWDGAEWKAIWRIATDPSRTTEDELAANLTSLCQVAGIPMHAESIVVASVVPTMDTLLERFATKYLGVKPKFLRTGPQVGIPVQYRPVEAVGADRIANALAALHEGPGPYIIVDFGTATTFDVVSAEGEYLGGSIMTGVQVSMEALFSRAAKLPQVPLDLPHRAIGTNTLEALQSGIVLGYAGSVETLIARISAELPSRPTVIATGGLGGIFMGACPSLERYEPNLTLDGLILALSKID